MFRAAVGRLLAGKAPRSDEHQEERAKQSTSKGKPAAAATSLVKEKPAGVPISQPLPPQKAAKPEGGWPPRAPVTTDAPQPLEVGDSRLPLRSVKISFSKGVSLNQEDVERAASNFGQVSHVGKRGDKCFVVLFDKISDAIQCSSELVRFLPPTAAAPEGKLRVKYMGAGGLDDSYSSADLSMSIILPPGGVDADNSRPSHSAAVAEPPHIQAAIFTDAEANAGETRAHEIEGALTLDEFSLNQSLLQQSLLLEDNEAVAVGAVGAVGAAAAAAPPDGEAHDAKLVHSESNISLQSDGGLSLLSRAPSQLFGAEDDDDYAVGREEGGWKTANTAPVNLQIPHYNQQPTQMHHSRSLDDSLDDAEVAAQPAVSLSTKKPIQVFVGSPSSSPRSPSEPSGDEKDSMQQGVLEVGDLLEDDADSLPGDDYDNKDEDEDEGGEGTVFATTGVTRVEADASRIIAKPPKPTQSVLVKVPAISLPVRPPKTVDTANTSAPLQAAEMQKFVASSVDVEAQSLEKRFNELTAKVRLLEAEARVRSRERSDLEREMQICEENWETELTELEIRNAKLETECNALKESNRRARIEAARTAGELSAAVVAKNAAEALLEGASAKAESDALAAIFSHQRLIGILDKQKNTALASLAQHREELSLLRGQHKAAVVDSLEWKARALHAEAKLGAVERPATFAAIGNVSGATDSNEELDDDRTLESKTDDEDAHARDELLQEASSRASVQQEMTKYLTLLNKSADHHDEHLQPPPVIFDRKPPLSSIDLRLRRSSEKVAIDLAESRRKLEALRSTSTR